MNDEISGKDTTGSKDWTYRGRQVKRGGGEFIGGDSLGLDAALQSVGLAPDQLSSPPPDELEVAFAPLRELAKPMPAVASVIDLLVAELRKGAVSQDQSCADYVRMIIVTLPGGAAACRELLQRPPVDKIAGPLLREAIAQAPA